MIIQSYDKKSYVFSDHINRIEISNSYDNYAIIGTKIGTNNSDNCDENGGFKVISNCGGYRDILFSGTQEQCEDYVVKLIKGIKNESFQSFLYYSDWEFYKERRDRDADIINDMDENDGDVDDDEDDEDDVLRRIKQGKGLRKIR